MLTDVNKTNHFYLFCKSNEYSISDGGGALQFGKPYSDTLAADGVS
jgi:hypothetical protein